MESQYRLQFGLFLKIIKFSFVLVIKNNKNVKFALCNIRGKIKGEWHNGFAKLEPNNRWVFAKINEKYGIFAYLMNILYKIKKMDIIILSIELRK